jgi:phosphoesterase RecJ-like protein
MYTRFPVPQGVLDFISGGDSFLVAGHEEPDGDCVGSQLALGELLEQLGKKVALVSAGPWRRSEIVPFQKYFKDAVGECDEGTRLIVVDCSSPQRTGKLADALAEFPTAVIDHHQTSSGSGLGYVNPTAPAAVVLILALWEAFGRPLTRKAAEHLLFGLCTDTGFFRHIDDDAEVLADAQKLAAAGGNLKKTFHAINGNRSFNSRKLLGTVLSGAESYYDGRLIVCTEDLEVTEHFGREDRDSDMLYQLLQSVSGTEAVVVVRQDTTEKCAVGFRSKDGIDVSKIAYAFGGGGHKNAAGAQTEGKIPELKARIVSLFGEYFPND